MSETNTGDRTEAPRVVTLPDLEAAVVRAEQVPMGDLRELYDSGYSALGAVLAAQGVRPAGAAFAHYLRQPSETVDVELGFPTDRPVEATTEGSVEVVPTMVPGGEAAQLVHVGGYDSLGQSWDRLVAWVVEQGREPGERLLEEYVTEPTPDADPATMRTRLSCFLAD